MSNKVQQIVLSYLRAGAAAVLTLYIADASRPLKDYLVAFVGAIAAPVLKALDPSATEFGRGSN